MITRNADMPAMPSVIEIETDKFKANVPAGYSYPTHEDVPCHGLTKREMFAMHAMSAYLNGQLSWTNGVDGGSTPSPEEVAEESVNYADALLKELEK